MSGDKTIFVANNMDHIKIHEEEEKNVESGPPPNLMFDLTKTTTNMSKISPETATRSKVRGYDSKKLETIHEDMDIAN